MRFFKRTPDRHPAHGESIEAGPVDRRRQGKLRFLCANCRLHRPPAVYMENDNFYCKPCAVRCYDVLHLRPVGRRVGDVTLAELIAS